MEYFEVDKIDAQAEAIKNVLYNNERRDELITLGRIRLADFSWQKSGQLHYELYKSMI